MALVDRTGERFGRLTVLERDPSIWGAGRHAHWLCECECGVRKVVSGNALRRGTTRSCGCLAREVKPPAWLGDDVSYRGLHHRVQYRRGLAATHACVDCQGKAEQWSYAGACGKERVGATGYPYCPHIEHYEPRCRKCHHKYDYREKYRGEEGKFVCL